jgi:hypothetical protein
MLNELVSIFEVVERVLEKRKANGAERVRDKVLVAIYELGNKGSHAVTSTELETKGDFPKSQIFNAIESAKSSDWIIDASSFDGMAWMLKRNAIYYVEGLLEGKGTSK